ncbi:30S ribosomal protein S9 [Candidatus Kapabacteria bacterium]|nr:30S ribosomal protein S9 [Candidatus Kapabacteria bacterium]
MMKQFRGTGRRKTSVATARMIPGTGKITVNAKEFNQYFPIETHQKKIHQPLEVTSTLGTFDIFIKVSGGGITGQVEASQLAISRALLQYDEELRPSMKEKDLLTRDPRMVERKKYGLKKARKSFQFSKR